MIRVKQNPDLDSIADKFERSAELLERDVKKGIRSLAKKYEAFAGDEARGGRSGTISQETNAITSGKKFRVELGKIAGFHITGTGIHGPRGRPITPARASVLHFFVGGTEVFARHVQGVTPDDYIERAHEVWLDEAEREMQSIAEKFANRL